MSPKTWVNISFALAAILLALVLGQLGEVFWDYFRLPASDLPVTYPALVAAAGGLAVFFALVKNQKVVLFMDEVVLELSKVTWPVKKETALSAVIVVIMVGIAAIILFLFDTVWGSLTQKLFAV